MDECEKELREGPYVVKWLQRWEREEMEKLQEIFQKVHPENPELWREAVFHYFVMKGSQYINRNRLELRAETH